MKSASPALISLLASNQFLMADLLTITLNNGTVLRYTSADINIVSGGNTFLSVGPRMERGAAKQVIGTQVDTMELTLYPDTTDLVNGIPFLSAIVGGAFDGATVQLERAFMATWGDTTAGTVMLFYGSCSDVDYSRTSVKFTVKSYLELLNIQMPRNLYQPPCNHTLYDTGCGLSKAAYTVSGTTNAGATNVAIPNGLAQAAGYFALGSLTYTGGANSGISRTVKDYTPGYITLAYPLPHAPAAGDTFTVYPGCDLMQATCANKFNNVVHFRGFPFVPLPQSAY